MPSLLTADDLAALVARPCAACGDAHVRARALASGRVDFLDGEAVSAVAWDQPRDPPAERVYRVECTACGVAVWERDDCPLCRAPGRLAQALDAGHGLAPLEACPRCGLGHLGHEVEVRMNAEYLHGRLMRRVQAATPREPGCHIREIACPDCEDHVATASSLRCIACGRSSLVRSRAP